MRSEKRLLARILVISFVITMILPGSAVFADNNPTIVVSSPAPYTVVTGDSVNVTGYVTDTASLKIKNTSVTIGSTGFFSHTVQGLTPGTNTIVITATGASGLTTTTNIPVIYDSAATPPAITVTSPPAGTTEVSAGALNLVGSATGDSYTIKLNGSQVSTSATAGAFNLPLTLIPGDNTIEIVAVKGGITTAKKIDIRYNNLGAGQPNIYNLRPADETTVATGSVVVSGTVYATAANGLTVNNAPVTFDSRGNFNTKVTLQPGTNTVTVKAVNGGLNYTTIIDITYSAEPIIVISSPSAGATVSSNSITVTGRVFNTETNRFFVNGSRVSFSATDGSFSTTVSLQNNINNNIEFEAYNGTLVTRKQLTVNNVRNAAIIVTSPGDNATVYTNSVTIKGKLEFAVFNTLKVGDKDTPISTDGSFSQTVDLESGENKIKISVFYNGSNPLDKTITLNYNPVLEDNSVFETTVADGDEVSAFEDAIKIKLAENSLGLDTNITVSVEDPYDLDENPPKQAAFLSPLFRLKWDDDPTKPYKITLEYDSVVRENQAHKVTVLFYDEDEEEWVILGGTADAKGKTISVETDREGYFAAAMYFRTFDDVYGHWAQRDIEFLVSKGAISGVSSTKFKPESNVTRAEFVTFLVKSLGWQPYEPEKRSYSDLDDDHWAYGYIEAALRAGLVTGVSHNKFAPDRYITREEAGAMLARAANLKTLKDQEVTKVFSDFEDAENISLWARNEVAATIKAKVLTGSDNGMFLPKSYTTRAQAAAMIARLVEVTGKSKSTTK